MRRRDFMRLLFGAATLSHAAQAQRPKKTPRLCFLTFDPGTAQSPSPRFQAFFQGLHELGYTNGETLTIDYLSAEGRTEQYAALAAECVRINPDIIAVTTTPGAQALKKATNTIPVVMVAVGDPVGTGIVGSLARPGGNITGMSQMTSEIAPKRLELLKEVVPGISRVLVLAYLVDAISPLQVKALREAAPALGVTLQVRDIQTADDLPKAFEAGVAEGAQGLMTTAESIFRAERASIAELASRYNLPAVYPYSAFAVDSNGLMAYEVIDSDLHRSAAAYVDLILKGAKPSDLPVQQPTKFRLVINLRTAKMLGLTIPPLLLAQADEVIE
jgi:putative tryptophan/tyrosine transport system substrate-binding protein